MRLGQARFACQGQQQRSPSQPHLCTFSLGSPGGCRRRPRPSSLRWRWSRWDLSCSILYFISSSDISLPVIRLLLLRLSRHLDLLGDCFLRVFSSSFLVCDAECCRRDRRLRLLEGGLDGFCDGFFKTSTLPWLSTGRLSFSFCLCFSFSYLVIAYFYLEGPLLLADAFFLFAVPTGASCLLSSSSFSSSSFWINF